MQGPKPSLTPITRTNPEEIYEGDLEIDTRTPEEKIESERKKEIARSYFVTSARMGHEYGLKPESAERRKTPTEEDAEEYLRLLEKDPIAYFNKLIENQDLLRREGLDSTESIAAQEKYKETARMAIDQITAINTKCDAEIAELEKGK